MKLSSRIRTGAWRSRWAAVGAALAVTLGAGGMVAVNAAPSAPSSFVAIDPARVYDGRISTYAQAGTLAPNSSKTISVKDGYDLDGRLTTSNVVPVGATSINYNITVTGLSSPNFVAVTPGDATKFTTSAINYTSTDLANAGSVQIDANRQIKLWGGDNTGSTFVIIDITGYTLPGGAGEKGDKGDPGDRGAKGDTGDPGPANLVPFFFYLDAGEFRTVATAGPLSVEAECIDLTGGFYEARLLGKTTQNQRVVMDGLDEFTGQDGNYLLVDTALDDRELISVTNDVSNDTRVDNDIDEGALLTQNGHYIGVDGETAMLGVRYGAGGRDCVFAGSYTFRLP